MPTRGIYDNMKTSVTSVFTGKERVFMRAEDVTNKLDLALAASGCDSATVLHRPRLLSDNGPSYIAGEVAEYVEANQMSHVRGAPCHPQTQG